MRIMAVDDKTLALFALEQAIREAEPVCDIISFSSAREALEHAQNNLVDVAFLDIQMKAMGGLSLAKKLKDINGNTNIVFVTGYPQYAKDAFALRASGYLCKPVLAEDIANELSNLRHPIEEQDLGVRIQCFGNFEIFVDGNPIHFHRSKAKEILAYLVNRKGAGVSKRELAGVLWEDASYSRTAQSHLQTLTSEMTRALDEAGAGHIIVKKWNSLALDTAAVNCDYYNFEKGELSAVNSYRGEYMANYHWAEFVTGWLHGQSHDR